MPLQRSRSLLMFVCIESEGNRLYTERKLVLRDGTETGASRGRPARKAITRHRSRRRHRTSEIIIYTYIRIIRV